MCLERAFSGITSGLDSAPPKWLGNSRHGTSAMLRMKAPLFSDDIELLLTCISCLCQELNCLPPRNPAEHQRAQHGYGVRGHSVKMAGQLAGRVKAADRTIFPHRLRAGIGGNAAE